MADLTVQLKDDDGNNLFPIAAIEQRQVYTGTTVPSSSLGQNGDLYVLLNGSAVGELLYAVEVE